MSSGEVSILTKIVFCITPLSLSASSDEKTTFPLAAPGDAGKPLAITFSSLFSSKLGCKRVSKVSDVVKEGDEGSVKVIGFDRGKVKLSIKEAS